MKWLLLSALIIAGCGSFSSNVFHSDRMTKMNNNEYYKLRNEQYYLYYDKDSVQLRQRVDEHGFKIIYTKIRDW